MPTQRNLMGTGCAAQQAQAAVGVPTLTFALGGSNQATAPLLPSDFVVATSAASNFGCIMPASTTYGTFTLGDTMVLVNHSGQTAKVYPVGSNKIANVAANFAVTTGKTATFYYIGADNWGAFLSN